jgi:hypothetical protein
MEREVMTKVRFCDTPGCEQQALGRCDVCGADVCLLHREAIDYRHYGVGHWRSLILCPTCRRALRGEIAELEAGAETAKAAVTRMERAVAALEAKQCET